LCLQNAQFLTSDSITDGTVTSVDCRLIPGTPSVKY